MGVRKLPPVYERVESGAIQFGNDWPGWFLRGDDAAYFLSCMESIDIPDSLYGRQIKDYLEVIRLEVIQGRGEDESLQHGDGSQSSR